MSNVDELLKKARKPVELAMKYHPFYQGKIEVVPKVPVRSFDDFAIWYTPGVAEPCKVINKNKDAVYEMTNKWNTIAVVSDGTRVLGLGDIGPEAGLPVMEGKAVLFKYLGGVDAFPLCLGTKNPDDIIAAVKWLQPSFGGINLEDLAQPKCFYILDRLRKEAEIPVWHDDQQGTATVVVAGAISALKVTGRKMSQAKMAIVGAGAACMATVRVLVAAGAKRENMIQVDSKGILHPGRKDIEAVKDQFTDKWLMCLQSNKEGKRGGTAEAMKGADIVMAMSKPGPGTITKDMVKGMASNAIVFAAANPIPEIWPWEAKEAGARIIATGRSDFPNQINNSLGFPGIFRGTLDVRAKTITDEMCIAAAEELAKLAEDRGLRDDYIIPNMDDWEIYPREARAVALKAIDQGIARVKLSSQELYDKAMAIIKKARDETQLLMKQGYISPPPP